MFTAFPICDILVAFASACSSIALTNSSSDSPRLSMSKKSFTLLSLSFEGSPTPHPLIEANTQLRCKRVQRVPSADARSIKSVAQHTSFTAFPFRKGLPPFVLPIIITRTVCGATGCRHQSSRCYRCVVSAAETPHRVLAQSL